MGSPERALSVTEILDVIEKAGNKEKVYLGNIFGGFGRRAYGPMLFVPALIAILPVVGALPGVSIGVALIALFVAVQLLLHQPGRGPKLPSRLNKVEVPRRALFIGLRWVRPVARWINPLVKTDRLSVLTEGAAERAVGVLAVFIALAMCVGALLPGTIVPPAIAMLLLALGLTSKDGVLIVLSALFAVGTIALFIWVFPF